MFMAFGVGIATLKFKEGVPTLILSEVKKLIAAGALVISENEGTRLSRTLNCPIVELVTVFPKPADLWSKCHQHTLLALFFVFSVAWALEQCVIGFRPLLSAHGPCLVKNIPF